MTNRSRPRTHNRSRFGGLVALLVSGVLALSSCSVYDLPLPGGADTGSDPIKVEVMFRDVLDLVPQSSVKVDDVTVGKVTAISLKGYVAKVTLELPRSIDLPDNARAEIRQTSLLGEKFVSLGKPADPVGRLADGDTIGLESSGRNPEIEEVFGALALLLNGGGVGQLKTIAAELNTAFEGREPAVRSVITQLRSFMTQLDRNKGTIITALENVNKLSLELRRQDGTIKQALDELPGAVKSINSQRRDLVRMLQALSRLSSVGVDVIEASKASTIDSLRNLAPVLEAFARAGQDFPDSLQVFLTYPFVDEAVGSDPEVARNLHMGDFTNLSVRMDLDLLNLPTIPGLPGGVSVQELIDTCRATPLKTVCDILQPGGVANPLCSIVAGLCKGTTNPVGIAPARPGKNGSTTSRPPTNNDPLGGADTGGGLLGGLLTSLGLGRPAPSVDRVARYDPFLLTARGYDAALGTLLLQGVAAR